jgi:hypothetical protein
VGWLKDLFAAPQPAQPVTGIPVPPQPRPRLPELSPEWAAIAEKVLAAIRRVDELDAGIYLIFQPDPHGELHVGLARRYSHEDDDWAISTFALPVPPEDRLFFPVDKDGMWEASFAGFTREDFAHAVAALLRYVYSSPAQMCPEDYAPSGEPRSLPLEISEEIVASLTGPDAVGPGRGAMEPGRCDPPAPQLIRTPHEAELTVAEWMRWLGYTNVGVTPVGADAGIDVYSDEALAQVKMEGVPTGRPVVQNAYGVAAAEGKAALVFSLGGYVHTAIDWADKVGIPLFRFDLQGVPEAVNAAARRLLNG